jgi:hypothetical protein
MRIAAKPTYHPNKHNKQERGNCETIDVSDAEFRSCHYCPSRRFLPEPIWEGTKSMFDKVFFA